MKFAVLAALMLSPAITFADSYKCVDREGKVSFAFTPCPTWAGDSTYYSPTQSTNLENVETASGEVVRRNLRAAEEMRRMRQSPPARNGTLTIVPDTTSGMAKERMRQEDLAKRRAARDARIAAGIEAPRPAPAPYRPPKSVHLDCYSYGNERQFTSCNGQ